MKSNLNEAKRQELIEMYNKVEDDLKEWYEKGIFTTENFFAWRDNLKTSNNNSSDIRNQKVEEAIKGNPTMELIYDWSKFYRIVNNNRGNTTKEPEGFTIDQDIADCSLIPTHVFYTYLELKHKGNFNNLFELYKIEELGLPLKNDFRRYNTAYEVINAFFNDEDNEPHSLRYLAVSLNALEITGEDLLTIGRTIEALRTRESEDIKSKSLVKKHSN